MTNNQLIKSIYAVLRQANVCHTDCEGNLVPALNSACYGSGGGATAFQCTDLAGCSLTDLGTKNYSDLDGLPVITDTTYTLVALGTTGFNLVDDSGAVISTINFPVGSSSSFTCGDLAGCSLTDLGTRNYSDLTGLPTIPTDVNQLLDASNLLVHNTYTIVATATGFTLNDQNGVVSTYTIPSGSTDTFVTITETATEYSFTPAGGGAPIVIPKFDCGDCDISDLTDTTGLLTHNTYTLVPTATGFNLVDGNSNIVSTITYPSGTTDTFVTIVENTDDYTFTPAGGGTDVVIPKWNCTDLGTCSLADLGTTNFSDLDNLPTLTQNGGNISGTIDLSTGEFALTGAVAGSADGVITGGTLNSTTGIVTYTAAAPASGFNLDLSDLLFSCADLANCSLADLGTTNYSDLTGVPTDISQFTDTTNLIKEYTLVESGLTDLQLLGDGAVVSTVQRTQINSIGSAFMTPTITQNSGTTDHWNYDIQLDLNIAPTQNGVPNSIQLIPGPNGIGGVYVPSSTFDLCTLTDVTTDVNGCADIDADNDSIAICQGTTTVKAPISSIVKQWAWYEGGDNFRVYATFDPFVSGYSNPSAGVYDFVVPSCHQLEAIEWIIGNGASGTINNMNTTNSTVINVTTPTGNTTLLNTSQANTFINTPTSGNNIFSSGDPNLVGTQTSRSFGGGTVTFTTNNLVNHVTGKVSISNLTQNPA